MEKITKEQRRNLELAIERAEGRGSCAYTYGSKPVCVIGQLIHLEGGKLSLLKNSRSGVANLSFEELEDLNIWEYPISLLTRIQNYWDHGTEDSEDQTRLKMVSVVQDYLVEMDLEAEETENNA